MAAAPGGLAAGIPGGGLLDTKQLGKPVLFYGDEEEFSDFRFLFYNYMGLIDIRIPGELKKLPAKEFEIVLVKLDRGE